MGSLGCRFLAGQAGRLEVIARLPKSDVGTRSFYTTQAWYDPHAAQLPEHGRLLGELSATLRAFLDDLVAAKLADRVVVLCFSEFGRQTTPHQSNSWMASPRLSGNGRPPESSTSRFGSMPRQRYTVAHRSAGVQTCPCIGYAPLRSD